MAVTLAQSMMQRLPELPLEPPDVFPRPLQVSAPSTDAIDAIKAWQDIDAEDLFEFRAWIVPNEDDISASLSQSYMPQTEAFHYLRNEADIVRASSLYLLHLVNEAIRSLTGTRSGIICSVEQTHGSVARTDISWSYTDGYDKTHFAILELKNSYVLNWNDFIPGRADLETPGRAPAELIQAAYDQDLVDNSWLGRNARIVSKQTRKYFENTGCCDIAVFDWKSMFVFDFSNFDEGADQLAGGTWFQESPDCQWYHTFRMLLFGMLCRALRRHQIL